MVGPYDLSASMGLTGKFQSVQLKNSIKFILDSCQQLKIPVGIHIVQPEPSELIEKINEGYQFWLILSMLFFWIITVLGQNMKEADIRPKNAF